MRIGRYKKAVLSGIVPLLILVVRTTALNGQDQATSKPVSKAAAALDEEARKTARLYFDSRFTKCGASYYTHGSYDNNGSEAPVYLDAQGSLRWRVAPTYMPAQHAGEKVVFDAPINSVTFEEFKYKGALFSVLDVAANPISPADRLNRVEWHGVVSAAMPPGLYRERSAIVSSRLEEMQWKPWSEWRDVPSGHWMLRLIKKRGQWFEWFAQDRAINNLGPAIESCSVKSRFLPFGDDPTFQPERQPVDQATDIDPSRMVVVSAAGLRYAPVSSAQSRNKLTNFTFELAGTLPVDTLLVPNVGAGSDGEMVHAETTIAGIGPAYLFMVMETRHEVLVPVSDFNSKTKPSASK